MFCCWNKSQITQCLITHRKHVKRRLIDICESKRSFSSGKYTKLGNLYARLGLLGDASQSDIKEAYYKLSKEHHPDRNEGCDKSTEKFRSFTEAYEILGNASTRAQYDAETPYGRMAKNKSRYKSQRPQPSSAFSEKDEEFADKIRTYRENMRRKGPMSSENEEFTFRRENVFDFDAWYRAHFHDDFDTKIRDERKILYARQYEAQMKRMAQGFRIRPPRPFLEPKDISDIEKQVMEMKEKEIKKQIKSVLWLTVLCVVGFIVVIRIVDENLGGYQDFNKTQHAKPAIKTDEK